MGYHEYIIMGYRYTMSWVIMNRLCHWLSWLDHIMGYSGYIVSWVIVDRPHHVLIRIHDLSWIGHGLL